MAKNYGLRIGASVRGYYDGRNMRMDAEDRTRDREDYDEDRKRTLRIQDQTDPIDLEMAMLRLQDAKRTGELGEYIQNKGYGKKSADVKHKTEQLGLETKERQGRVGAKAEPGDMLAIGYRDNQAKGNNELYNKQQPISMRQTDFSGKMLDDQVGQYDQGQEFWNKYENVQKALGSFNMTGNPKILMDAYDMYIDDGIDAVIEKIPGEEGKGPSYRVSTNNGQPPAEFESKEALLEATERVFMDHLQRIQPVSGGYGIDAGGGGMNRGMPGRNVDYGDYPSDVKTAEYLIEAMQGIERYKDLSPEQMRMEAFKLANAKVDDTPESDIRQFFVKTFMQQMKGPAGGLGPAPDPAEAWETATQMTEKYRYERHGIGQKPKIKVGGEGEEGKTALENWIKAKSGV